MRFYIFNSEAEANAVDDIIVQNVRAWALKNAPELVSQDGHLRGRNAATGQLSDRVTIRWDEPRTLADGRFAILKPHADRMAPMPLSDAIAGIDSPEISEEQYQAALPKVELP